VDLVRGAQFEIEVREPWFSDTFAEVPPLNKLNVLGSPAVPVPTTFAAGIKARSFGSPEP